MLNIFYGRESIDKDKFIFKKVNKDERTLILVPDQFTLQGERNAFKYLGISSLMDVEILSPSGMGNRVLKETGNDKREKIGRYGCHMLLSEIIREEKNNLKVFAGMDGKSSFVTLAKNLIADMKQYNTNQEGLKRIVDSLEGDSILKDKLHDMEIIYGRYENKLKDKMLDPEDCLDLVIDSIKESKLIRDSHIWVTGFNTFTPKNLKLMEKLLISALSFNVVLTCDRDSQDKAVFEIANQSVYRFEQLAKDNHIQYRTIASFPF